MILLWVGVAAAGDCEVAKIGRLVDALETLEVPAMLPVMAATGVAQACSPRGTEALEAVQEVPPERAPLVDRRLAIEAAELWIATCPEGPSALAATVQAPAPADRLALWSACSLADRGHLTEAEWRSAPGLTYAPVLVGGWLAAEGIEPGQVRVIVRALAGISDRPRDEPPVREFTPLFP